MKIPYEERKLISLTLGLKCNLKIPRNESEIFEYESPKKIIKEKENIDLLRETMFHKKIWLISTDSNKRNTEAGR